MIYFYTNGNLAWLKIAKNACSSWSKTFTDLGWRCEDLYHPSKPLGEFEFFGFIQDPDQRHSSGIAQYIHNERLERLLESTDYQRLCVSAVFDEHSYSIHSTMPSAVLDSATWFVMDHEYFDYETLVRNFLKSHGIDLPPVPRLNQSSPAKKLMVQKINDLKKQYPEQHAKLAKNFLGSDLKLYRTVVQTQHEWAK
jgi:hypothetical protein